MTKVTKALVKKAMVEDLEKSGITTKYQVSKLRVNPLTKQEMEDFTGIEVPGYEIPYFNKSGKQLAFSRVKFLLPVPGNPNQKYWQQPETLPHIYLPPFKINNKTWSQIFQSTKTPIYITEGEKKAACACINKLPCIGLGGVWSFKSKKEGKPLIKELEAIKWKNRDVYIVYDSDVMYKPDVLRALETLHTALLRRGAKSINSIYLQSEDNQKLGLDDFIVEYGVDELHNQIIDTPNELLTKLNELNTRYAIVKDLADRIFSLETRKFIPVQSFIQVTEATNQVNIIDESGKPKKVKAAKEWVEWVNRREVNSIVFSPGESTITQNNEFNYWRGYPYTPKRGNTKPFLNLINSIFKNTPKEIKDWFLQWVAYPLQHPGTKLNTCVLIWGGQGTGKTFLGRMLKDLYGPHGKWITQLSMSSGFNEWAVNTQFVLADEVVQHGDRRDANHLKNLITQEEVFINQKYQPSYSVKDYTNYYFTSNHSDAIYLEPDDRRFLIVEAAEKQTDKFYKDIDKWIQSPEASQAIMYYLLNQVDTQSFNPKAQAPITDQKRDMIHETMSSLDQVLDEALRNPDSFFALGNTPIKRDLFTAEEVHALLPTDFKNTSRNAIGRSLRRAGAIKRPVNIKLPNNQWIFKRVYAVRDQEKWRKAKQQDLAKNYLRESIKMNDDSNVVQFPKKKRRKKFVDS